MSDILAFDAVADDAAGAVGGKGLSLARMTRAGLPVPPGFCLTAEAHRAHRGRPLAGSPQLREQVLTAYRHLGGGPVAVRSSATAEDGSAFSFAGQQETLLGIDGEPALLDAVDRCWASLDTERAAAYRRRQGIAEGGLAMAVVVQRLVPAEVAGVLFTRDPLDPEGKRMLAEASWGLGESVVSGRVHPDRFVLDRATGQVLERHVSTKATEWSPAGPKPIDAERQTQPCLDDGQLAALAELGRRVADFYGDDRDVEWAWAAGQFWLLQARPITADAAERARVRRDEIVALESLAEPEGTIWARFNLSEVLPEPTPLTWALVRRMLSGRGGMGQMYRDLGFDPDPSLDDLGIFDLICGRPYCNLNRQLRLQFRRPPFAYPFAAFKAAPQRAFYPQPEPAPGKANVRFWLTLPWLTVRLSMRLARLRKTVASQLRESVFPEFARRAEAALVEDLSALDDAALLGKFTHWSEETLDRFSRESLKPTALAGVLLEELQGKLARKLGMDRARAALGELMMGVHPDPEADLPTAVRELAAGRLDQAIFLDRFGHRGSHEMELSHPRWSEDTVSLRRLLAAAGGDTEAHETGPWEAVWQRVSVETGLPASTAETIRELHTFLGLRETGKHYLMLGFAVLRRLLLEFDRRHRLDGGVFFLLPEELPRLAEGETLTARIAERQRRRRLALSLEVPPVLFSDDLDAIGRPVPVEGTDDALQGVPLSAGVAEGPALVLEEPTDAVAPTEPYILVCPSTDPAWVPLFVHARGLVMETGGVLSHGAIVAREFGLPAVAGLPGIHRRLQTGQRLHIDGGNGRVRVVEG